MDKSQFESEVKLDKDQIEYWKKRKNNFVSEAENYRKPYENIWLDNYKLFSLYKEDLEADRDWESNLHIPIPLTMICTAAPLLLQDYIDPVKSFATVAPRNLGDPDDVMKAHKTENGVRYQFREMIFARTMVDTVINYLVYGTAWQKAYWKRSYKRLKRRIKNEDMALLGIKDLAFEIMRQDTEVFNGPMVDRIDPFYLWPDGRASYDNYMTRYKHDVYMYTEEVKALVGSGTFNQYEGTLSDESDRSMDDTYGNQRLTSIGLGTVDPMGGNDTKRLKITEYFDSGHFTWWLNDDKLMRYEYEPFYDGGHNLVLYKFWPKPDELFGMGMIDMIRTISEEIDFMYNMRNNQVILTLNRPYFLDDSRLVNPNQDLAIEPNGFIRINSGEPLNGAIMPVPLAEPSPNAYREHDMLHNLAQMITGINDYMRGQSTPSMNDTATGINIITQRAMSRFMFHHFMMGTISVPLLMRKIIGLNNLYLESDVQWVQNDQQYSFGPDDVIESYDIIPRVDPQQQMKEMERAHMQQGIQAVGSIQQMNSYQNWGAISNRFWKLFGTIENPQELTYTEEQMQAKQQQAMQQQMEMQAQQQAMMQQTQQAQIPPPQQGPPPQEEQPMPPELQMGPGDVIPPQRPPLPNMPPIESPIDLIKQLARGRIGNNDKQFE